MSESGVFAIRGMDHNTGEVILSRFPSAEVLMTERTLRIGLIGAGGNMRLRPIPGLRGGPHVEIVAVCNRRSASTRAIAQEFGIPRTNTRWQDMIADPGIDAIVIGTWPYLH